MDEDDDNMIALNNISDQPSLFRSKPKKCYYCTILSLYLISIMILILNIIIILVMYYTYVGVQASIDDLKSYINNSIPSVKRFLDNYTLKISLG